MSNYLKPTTKFKDVFTNLSDFETLVWTPLQNAFTNAEFLDDTKIFSKKEQILFYLNTQYNNRYIRYEVDEFLGYFKQAMLRALPKLYLRQLAWVNKELDQLKEIKARDEFNLTKRTPNLTTNESSTSNAFSGTNTPLEETDNVATKLQTKALGTEEVDSDRYNIINNLENIMNAKFSFALDEFLKYFENLFTQYEYFDISGVYNNYIV